MERRFFKLAVGKSDFILVDDSSSPTEAALEKDDAADAAHSALARAILDRRRGAGALALVRVKSGETHPILSCRLPDGSSVESVDALLCAARYLFDSGRGRAGTFPVAWDGEPDETVEVEVVDARSFRVKAPSCKAESRTAVDSGGARRSVIRMRDGKGPGYAVLLDERPDRDEIDRLQAALAGMCQKGEAVPEAILGRQLSSEAFRMGRARDSAWPAGLGRHSLSSRARTAEAAAALFAAARSEGLCEDETIILDSGGVHCLDVSGNDSFVTADPEYLYEGIWRNESPA